MPNSPRFFLTEPSLVELPLEDESTDLSIEDLLILGKEISELNLADHGNVFLLRNISHHLTITQQYHQALIHQRDSMAAEYSDRFKSIVTRAANINLNIQQSMAARHEYMQVLLELIKSHHIHDLLQDITAKGDQIYACWQQYPGSAVELKQRLVELQVLLERAQRGMDEVAPLSSSLLEIIKQVVAILATYPLMEKTHACFFDNLRLVLTNLSMRAALQKQNLHLMMLIKAMVSDELMRDFVSHQDTINVEFHTVFSMGQTLNYLNAEIKSSHCHLESIARRLDSQRQRVISLADHKSRLFDIMHRDRNKHLIASSVLLKDPRVVRQVLNDLQPIMIQDIVVTQPPRSGNCGEVDRPHDSRDNCLYRMVQQIQLLADLARQQHQKNCTDTGQLKNACENNITRLITDEFSFYPSKPLTIAQYEYLLRDIRAIAKKLPLNIHLILASFPVLDTHYFLHNITVHVTSGATPRIHHHSKASPSLVDITYGHSLAYNFLPWLEPQMPEIHPDKPLLFGFGGIVYSETAGGARLINNLEICLEHNFNIGNYCLKSELRRAELERKTIPMQYSQILTSHSTLIIPMESHNFHITQADAHAPGVWIRDQQTQTYNSLHPKKIFELNNYFGNSHFVHVFEPQQATYLPGDLFEVGKRSNLQMIKDEENDIQEPAPPCQRIFP